MVGEQKLPPAVFLMGPTASGKTALAEQLVQQWPFEVISVDSALVYRGMDIGTAKPGTELLRRLPHRLIDIREPHQSYSVAEFRQDALQHMHEITQAGRIPLLVGGTMMYFKVLLEGIAELPATDPELRQQILEQAERLGWPEMHRKLQSIDPAAAAELHPNHSQRIQRALEVYYLSGQTLTELQSVQSAQPLPYRLAQFAIWPDDRASLHRRIELRFKQMLEEGFLDEVRQLRQRPELHAELPAMRAVGYRQAWQHLDGETTHAQFVEQGVAATRQLAKRQLTWLRKWVDIVHLPLRESSAPRFNSSNWPISVHGESDFHIVMQELTS